MHPDPLYPDAEFTEKYLFEFKYKIGVDSLIDFNKFRVPHKYVKDYPHLYKKDGKYQRSFILSDEEPVLVEDEKFDYSLNEHGFRSKSFYEFDKNKKNILIAGCSISMGVGLPENLVWHSKLINNISQETGHTFDKYNLSFNGSSIELQVRNILTFIQTVGVPDYLFMYLPQASRGLYFDDYEYKDVHYEPRRIIEVPNDGTLGYVKSYKHENIIFQKIMYLHLLETLCDSYGIKVLWTTWNGWDQKVYNKKFNHFFISDVFSDSYTILHDKFKAYWNLKNENDENEKINEFNKKNINNEPYWAIARDGMHPGAYNAEKFSESFMLELKRRKMI
jgi:hypothetical protein